MKNITETKTDKQLIREYGYKELFELEKELHISTRENLAWFMKQLGDVTKQNIQLAEIIHRQRYILKVNGLYDDTEFQEQRSELIKTYTKPELSVQKNHFLKVVK